MKKPKILFVYDHKKPEYWMDGLYAALKLLEEDLEINKINLVDFPNFHEIDYENTGSDRWLDYKFVLGWGAFNGRVDNILRGIKNKKGICIAGNTFPPTGANNYDVLFYETKWYRPQINFHKNIVQAFGVNTDIFFPNDLPTPIVWDYIGVGALALWKRWNKFNTKKGTKLVIGEVQIDNLNESIAIIQDLLLTGTMVSNMIHPIDLSRLYYLSRTLYMPSDINGGGERSILEARACGLEVEIENDNPKLLEMKEWSPIPDHHWYAKQLKKGILSVL